MKLSSRGIHYGTSCGDTSADLTTPDSQMDDRSRSPRYAFYYPRHIPTAVPIVGTPHRDLALGIHNADVYAATQTTINLSLESTMESSDQQPLTNTHTPARNNRRHLLRQVAETHRANIRQQLEHRLNVARERGDQALIQMLEAEYQQFA